MRSNYDQLNGSALPQLTGRQANNLVESSADSNVAPVRNTIRQAGLDLRKRYPFLRFQSAIGLGILLSSAAGVLAVWMLYIRGRVGALGCIVAVAFLTSLIHEIEHDTIHRLYFKNNRLVRGVMFLIGWIMRPNMPNPWFRETIHLHHHRNSGRPEDIEEQGIGNGSPYGLRRFLVMADVSFAVFMIPQLRRNSEAFEVGPALASLIPFNLLFTGTWLLAVGIHLWAGLHGPLASSLSSMMTAVDLVMVLVVFPAALRGFCITFLSSSMHYFGGVGGVLTETQVLNPWFLQPLQWFSFWFGATHGIHHIVVGQPFYIRHAIREKCYPAMRAAGVHFNDLGTFLRRNHYPDDNREGGLGLAMRASNSSSGIASESI